MRRTLLLAALLVAVVASAAIASVPAITWYVDDFSSYVDATRLRDTVPWDGTGPENRVYGGEVRMRGDSGTHTSSSSYIVQNVAPQSAGNLQIMHVRLRGENLGTNPGNHAYIYMREASGGNLAFWYGHSDLMTPRYSGGVAPNSVNLTDRQYHDLDILYNPVTGLTQWLADGVEVWSVTQATGWAVERISLDDTARGSGTTYYYDNVLVDHVALGTVIPEPSSLIALATGLGALGFVIRRRS